MTAEIIQLHKVEPVTIKKGDYVVNKFTGALGWVFRIKDRQITVWGNGKSHTGNIRDWRLA